MSAAWPRDIATRGVRGALRLVGGIVPPGTRDRWLDEWEAELWQLRRHDRGVPRLVLFVLGALWAALW